MKTPLFFALAAVCILASCNSRTINPDSIFVFNLSSQKQLTRNKGFIRVYETATNRLVDSIDLSVPDGPETSIREGDIKYATVPYQYARSFVATNANTPPGTPSGQGMPTSTKYQLDIIGGFTDGFHFHPIIYTDSTAKVYLHHNVLDYGKKYRMKIDKNIVASHSITFKFSTKHNKPLMKDTLVVSCEGKGDFNTIQGALDFIPDNLMQPVVVFVKNGDYEELVYFRNKRNVTLLGESRDGVVIHYPNNEVFNPHPMNIRTNELLGTFPSRRVAFAADNCSYMVFRNLTIKNDLPGQAEGLLLMGDHNRLYNVKIIGDGDALQVNGSTYFKDCVIDGGGDTVLGRGPSFFNHCSLYNRGGAFTWIRNTQVNHGDVFLNCKFANSMGRESSLGRAPMNKGRYYPYNESVFIHCELSNIVPEGWESVDGETSNMHFWEYDSHSSSGTFIDVSSRNKASRQLKMPDDDILIRNYSNPDFILDWNVPEK